MGDSPGDSDTEEEFTFGSFTLEDTLEFKKNYNGLPKVKSRGSDTGRRRPNGVANRSAGATVSKAPEVGPEAETPMHVVEDRPRMPRASSPAPALPVEPATAEQEAEESARCPAVVEQAPPKDAEDATGVGQTAGSTTPVECANEDPGRRSGDVAPATAGVGDRDPGKGAVVDRTDSVPALGDGSERKVRPSQTLSWAQMVATGSSNPTRLTKPVPASVDQGAGAAAADPASKGSSDSADRAPGTQVKNGKSGGVDSVAAGGVCGEGGRVSEAAEPIGDTVRSGAAPAVGHGEGTPLADLGTAASAAGSPAGARKVVNGVDNEDGVTSAGTQDTAATESASGEAESQADAREEARAWAALLGILGREDGNGEPEAPAMSVDLVHRGLVNTGNSCFRSVVLQALLACDPFIQVVFRASPALKNNVSAQEALPTWAQLARFAAAFEPPKPGALGLLSPKPAPGSQSTGGWSAPVVRTRGRNRGSAGTVSPVLPDEEMSKAFGAFRSANTGEQEDAQEFMAFFLDQLHEEIVNAKKEHQLAPSLSHGEGFAPDAEAVSPSASAGRGGQTDVGREDDGQGDGDAWMEIGRGRAKAVVNTPDPRRRGSNSSVITGLFYGMFRSEVKKSGSAKSSVTLEPFHCLQLDLDPPASSSAAESRSGPGGSGAMGAWGSYEDGYLDSAAANGGVSRANGGGGGRIGDRTSAPPGSGGGRAGRGAAWGGAGMSASGAGATSLDEALAALFGGESVAGVKGRQNMEVKASRTLTLEQAPQVLTLHLKQFSFHPDLGPRKLARRVRYPLELVIPTKIMSPSLQHRTSKRDALKYRLFTVVLHHGRSLHGGHYTALVRDARGAWRHCDDQTVFPETEGHALNPMSGHPYLLLYTLM